MLYLTDGAKSDQTNTVWSDVALDGSVLVGMLASFDDQFGE